MSLWVVLVGKPTEDVSDSEHQPHQVSDCAEGDCADEKPTELALIHPESAPLHQWFASGANAECCWPRLDPRDAAQMDGRERCVISRSHAFIMPSAASADDRKIGSFRL